MMMAKSSRLEKLIFFIPLPYGESDLRHFAVFDGAAHIYHFELAELPQLARRTAAAVFDALFRRGATCDPVDDQSSLLVNAARWWARLKAYLAPAARGDLSP
jgi:hypothetical protein